MCCAPTVADCLLAVALITVRIVRHQHGSGSSVTVNRGAVARGGIRHCGRCKQCRDSNCRQDQFQIRFHIRPRVRSTSCRPTNPNRASRKIARLSQRCVRNLPVYDYLTPSIQLGAYSLGARNILRAATHNSKVTSIYSYVSATLNFLFYTDDVCISIRDGMRSLAIRLPYLLAERPKCST